MAVPEEIIASCFILLMLVGAFLAVYSVLRLITKEAGKDSELNILGNKFSIKGPAWLILTALGVIMASSPVLAAVISAPMAVTVAPPSVQQVQEINEPDVSAFRFLRDVSVLDLRQAESAPWYTVLPGFRGRKKVKNRPGVVKNYMVVKKMAAADKLHLTYSSSGLLDVKCLTQQAIYQQSQSNQDGVMMDTRDVGVDVSTVPVGSEFEVAIEATYWNGFNGDTGDNYTTYAHHQTEPEELSTILIFPLDKPMKSLRVLEYPPHGKESSPFQGASTEIIGSANHTFYWRTTNTRPGYFTSTIGHGDDA